jgi:hypothetical protein
VAEVVIPVHRVATVWLLVGSIAFVVYGLTFPVWFPSAGGFIAGLIIVAIFGLQTFWWTAILRSPGLRLTRDGLEVGVWRLSWSQVDRFYCRRLFGVVGPETYVRADIPPAAQKSRAVRASYLLGLSWSTCGPPVYISTWAFDSDGPLCDILEAWRLRYSAL